MSVYRTIVKNFAANTFGLGVNFIAQIAMVPLYIAFWGVNKYADWILITAFSSFFAMTDLGLNRASNNAFVIKYQQKKYDECKKLQSNAFLFVLCMFAVFFLISVFIYLTIGFKGILGVKYFTEAQASFAFILLITDTFTMMYGRVYHGIYRAISKTHFVIVVDNITRVFNLLILFFCIYFNVNVITMLVLYILPSLAGVLFKHVYSRRIFPSHLSISNFDFVIFKAMIKPALAFMFFPLGQAISAQGMVFVINTLLGGTVLVAFTTTRTLVNFLRQLMNMLSTSINPEICAAYGRNDYRSINDIYNRALVLTFLSTLLCVIGLLIFGPYIYGIWTKHAVVFNEWFFVGMLTVLFVTCLSGLSSVIPLSTNTHERFTIAFILLQAVGVLSSYLLLRLFPRLELVPLALIITETALFIFIIKENNSFLNISLREMFSGLWYQTKFFFQKGKLIFHKVV